ncbi:MAG: DUF3267 domain-containing protein [Clostridia bacterium]|nr:DUF3267 domain-containing protein [Clostridia bacterium]
MVQVNEFRLTKLNSFFLNIASGIIFFIGYILFLMAALRSNSDLFKEAILQNNSLFLTLLFVILTAFLHELVHGAACKFFGGKVKYGIKLLNLYTMDTSGNFYKVPQMLVIMLLPLFTISLVFTAAIYCLPHYVYYLCMCILFNISGSIGDISMATFIILKGRGCRVRDEEYGFSLHQSIAAQAGEQLYPE